jgi:hypothetical protein
VSSPSGVWGFAPGASEFGEFERLVNPSIFTWYLAQFGSKVWTLNVIDDSKNVTCYAILSFNSMHFMVRKICKQNT